MVRKNQTEFEPCESLEEWLNVTGVGRGQLLKMLEAKGVFIRKAHLANIISGVDRLGMQRSRSLSEITGISVHNLRRGYRGRRSSSGSPDSQGSHTKSSAINANKQLNVAY